MLGSLFCASAISIIMSGIDVLMFKNGQISFIWLFSSVVAMFLLSLAYQGRRKREIDAVYLYTLVAAHRMKS